MKANEYLHSKQDHTNGSRVKRGYKSNCARDDILIC